ncbi:MAG: hypothetical protein HQ567_03020 [Candidatus Nealsonbacteria bacterium]|nr:hypothetical protein [Candidatus Nealsonbacteria bacterium]
MSTEPPFDLATYLEFEEILRIGRRAVHKAQEESRRLGVPNVYSINGFLYYELPSGELSRTDPYPQPESGSEDG